MDNNWIMDPDDIEFPSFRKILHSGVEFLKTEVIVEGHPFAKPIPAVVYGKQIKRVESPIRSHKAFFIPGSVLSSKNHKRILRKRLTLTQKMQDTRANLRKYGRRYPIREYRYYIGDTKAVENYKKKTAKYFREFAEEFRKESAGMTPVYVEFLFVRNTRSVRWDFPNMVKLVIDQMRDYSWIVDDTILNICPVPPLNSPVVAYDKYHPGVRITALQFQTGSNFR